MPFQLEKTSVLLYSDTMKIRTIITSVILLLLVVLVAFVATSAPRALSSARRAFDSARRAIPAGIQFFEENEDFFDLLLDIQQRTIEFNNENEDGFNGFSFDIVEDELRIRGLRGERGT